MPQPVNNIINVDYPLCSVYNVPSSRSIKFFTGYLFPSNNNIEYAIIDRGDGTTIFTYFSDISANYRQNVTALGVYDEFFPVWYPSFDETVSSTVPKFTGDYTYEADGNYQFNVTLVTDKGLGYRGTPVTLSVESKTMDTIPPEWEVTTSQYTITDSVDDIYIDLGNGFSGAPLLSSVTQTVSSIPIDATLFLLNVAGRTDVDYVEWNFGDGTSKVVDFRGGVVFSEFVTQYYSYPIMPSGVSYTPTATIYFTRNNKKKKFTVTGNEVILAQRFNIIPSIAAKGETSNDIGFTIQPWLTPNVLTDSTFTINIQKDLQYVIMDFGDGKFDVIAATYTPTLSSIAQSLTLVHRYESTNFNKILPNAIFVYKDGGRFYSKQYRAKRFVEYGRDNLIGILDGDYYVVPVIGTNGFRKFNNISVQPIYKQGTAVADIVIRLDIGLSNQIFAFEKIVWTINNTKIVQDKQTTKHFGYLTLKDVALPYIDFSISADLYGIPAVYSLNNVYNLKYIDTFDYTLNIVDFDTSLFIDEANIINTNSPPVLGPTVETTTVADGVEVISIETPILDVVGGAQSDTTTYASRSYIFDKVFSAINPVKNFINRSNPSTVSSPTLGLETKRDVGFFRPSKSSSIVIDGGKFSFVVNLDEVNTDTIYYVPDPYKYGSDSVALTFNSEKASFKKGYSFGLARNEPNTTEYSTTFYGYTSIPSHNEYDDLSSLYDEGYIHDIKYDVFGNQYGLIKNNSNFRKYIQVPPAEEQKAIVFNGYKFFDSYFGGGYSFNYYTSRDYPEVNTYVPGISTRTGSLTSVGYQYKLKFGTFDQPEFPTNPTPIDVVTTYKNPIAIKYIDGGVFAFSDTSPVIDTVSSDLSSNQYPGSGSFYYTALIEAGAHQAIPYIRPLRDQTNAFTQSITANFTQAVVVSGDNGVVDIDAGVFDANYPSFNYRSTNSLYLSSINPQSSTQYVTGNEFIDTKINRDALQGSIYIKTQNEETKPFTELLGFAEVKYGSAVFADLSAVQNFDIVYNTYFIQTPSYLIIDRIDYNDGFTSPRTPNLTIQYNVDNYNRISNRFKHKNNVYFAVLSGNNSLSAINPTIIPTIYRFDLSKFELINMLPYSNSILSAFAIDSSILYTEVASPKLIYNEDIDEFNLSYILKDQNKTPTVISVRFDINDIAYIKGVSGFKFTSDNDTVVFSTLSAVSASFTTLAQSSTPPISSTGAIL